MEHFYLTFQAEEKVSLAIALEECFAPLLQQHKAMNILKVCVFVSASNCCSLKQVEEQITSYVRAIFPGVPVGLVFQSLADEGLLAVEACCCQLGYYIVNYKESNGISYAIMDDEDCKTIWAAGINSGRYDLSLREQSALSFGLMNGILQKEGMTMDNIVRQWSYIEDILRTEPDGKDVLQNYQFFNDVRRDFYKIFKSDKKYPAATGIGAYAGGITLDFVAVKSNTGCCKSVINSPLQKEAYAYGLDVLIGNSTKKAPLFERAMLLSFKGHSTLFVSGTASIKGQETVGLNDVEAQTRITIENIRELVSPENIFRNTRKSMSFKGDFSVLRVYIKRKEDAALIKLLCRQLLGNVPINFLIADVCRDNLLVEIEAELFFN